MIQHCGSNCMNMIINIRNQTLAMMKHIVLNKVCTFEYFVIPIKECLIVKNLIELDGIVKSGYIVNCKLRCQTDLLLFIDYNCKKFMKNDYNNLILCSAFKYYDKKQF